MEARMMGVVRCEMEMEIRDGILVPRKRGRGVDRPLVECRSVVVSLPVMQSSR